MRMQFWNSDVKKTLCKAIGCGFIPVLSCFLYCIFQRRSLGSIYLPNTACSDDIYYYKMVEGIVNFGCPLGYFGYNESHAMVSSFGVWSPLLLMPWALWGKIFGWGYSSPIICNICILSISFIVFAVLAKPTWKQAVSIAVLFFLFTPITRYILSGMPEAMTYSLMIIVYGIIYSYFEHEDTGKLIWLFLCIIFLSLMRPYFMVFLLFPGILWIRRSKVGGLLGTVLTVFLSLLGYKLITYFFAAPYFYSSMATDFTEAFKKEGFFAGCLFLIHKICDKCTLIKWNMSLGIQQGFTEGGIYFACCTAMLFLLIWLFGDVIKEKRQGAAKSKNVIRNIVTEASLLVCFVVMLLAIIVLYQVSEGSRHILVFLIGFIIVGAMRDDHFMKESFLIMAVFVYLFIFRYDDDSGYRVPYSVEDISGEIEDRSDVFNSYVSLDYSHSPSYENVVDWVIEDTVEGEKKEIPWKILFALPEGIGISCCLPQYMIENIDELNSRYIIMVPGGQVDLLCQEKGMETLIRDEEFVLYKIY